MGMSSLKVVGGFLQRQWMVTGAAGGHGVAVGP